MWIRMEPVDFEGSAAQPVRTAVRTGVFLSFRAPNRFEPRFEPANPVIHYDDSVQGTLIGILTVHDSRPESTGDHSLDAGTGVQPDMTCSM